MDLLWKLLNASGPPIIGNESLLPVELNSFPLFARLSMARSTSARISGRLTCGLYFHRLRPSVYTLRRTTGDAWTVNG